MLRYRTLFILSVFLPLATPTQGQLFVPYNNGDNDATAYDTSAPNDPTNLSINSGTATQSGLISGTGDVVKIGSGLLNLANLSNSYTGDTQLIQGTLGIIGDSNLGNGGTLIFNGGTLANQASFTISRNVEMGAGNGIINTGSGNLTLGGNITGSGNLTKTGLNTLFLTGSNSHSGTTLITDGILSVGNGGSTGSLGTGNVVNNSFLIFNRSGSLNVDQSISGKGDLILNGSGTVSLRDVNTYTGDTIVNSGTLRFEPLAIGDPTAGNIINNSVLEYYVAFGGDLTEDATISGTGSVYASSISSFSLTLTGNNTYSGGTTIEDITLVIGADNNLGDVSGDLTIEDATLRTNASFTSNRDITLNQTFGTQDAFISPDTGTTLTLGGSIGGTGNLVKRGGGTLILTGNSNFANGTPGVIGLQVSEGTLIVDGGTVDVNETNSVDVYGTGGQGSLIIRNGGNLINNTGRIHTDATATVTGAGSQWSLNDGGGVLEINGGALGIENGGLVFAGGITERQGEGSVTFDGGTLRLGRDRSPLFTNFETGDIVLDSGGGTIDTQGFTVGISVGFTGTGSLTKEGSGLLELRGPNTHSGGTIINAGTVRIRPFTFDDVTPGDIVNNGILEYLPEFFGDITETSNISGTGAVHINNPNDRAMVLSGNNTYEGGTLIMDGSLTVSADANLGDASGAVTFEGSALHTTASFNTNREFVLNKGNDLNTGFLIVDAGTTLTQNGTISGSGNLIKQGEGTLILTGNSDFATFAGFSSGGLGVQEGDVIIDGGTVELNSNSVFVGFGSSLGDNKSLTIRNGGILRSSRDSEVNGDGTMTITGAGSQWLTDDEVVTVGGQGTGGGFLIIENGGLLSAYQLEEDFQGGGSVTFDDGTLQLTRNQSNLFDRFESGDVILDAGGGTIDTQGFDVNTSISLVGTGSLTKTGSGKLFLAGNSTYSGGTIVDEGTLSLGSNTAAGTGTITTLGSVINYGDGLDIANPININSNTTQLQVLAGRTATQSGVISETGGFRPLEKIGEGTLTLTEANIYSGDTTVSEGTLAVENSAGSATGTGNVFVESGAMLAGAGNIDGVVYLNGVIAPGNSPGTMSVGSMSVGSMNWSAGGGYIWEINDATGTAGSDPGWDLLSISGSLDIDSTALDPFTIYIHSLMLDNTSGEASNFEMLANQSWVIASAGSINYGSSLDDIITIDTSGFLNLPNTDRFSVSIGGSDVILSYTIPEPTTSVLMILSGALFLARRQRS